MTKAERLAENLENPQTLPSDMIKAAAELRRLATINAELVKALELSLPDLSGYWKEKAVEALEKAKQ